MAKKPVRFGKDCPNCGTRGVPGLPCISCGKVIPTDTIHPIILLIVAIVALLTGMGLWQLVHILFP